MATKVKETTTFEEEINKSINKTEDINDIVGYIEVEKISKLLKEKAKSLTASEARYLTDAKIQVQKFRIRVQNQLRACKQEYDSENAISDSILHWLFESMVTIEKEITKAFIETNFSSEERHIRRNNLIDNYND